MSKGRLSLKELFAIAQGEKKPCYTTEITESNNGKSCCTAGKSSSIKETCCDDDHQNTKSC